MIPSGQLSPAQFANAARALNLLPVASVDVPPGGQLFGVAFTRTTKSTPGVLVLGAQGSGTVTDQTPPTGSSESVSPTSPGNDATIALPGGGSPLSPLFLDFAFTSHPNPLTIGPSQTPAGFSAGAPSAGTNAARRIILVAYSYTIATTTIAELGDVLLYEGARTRIMWVDFGSNSPTTEASTSPDGIILVAMSPSARTMAPADFTIACLVAVA
jgi:hypothetical protein